MIVENEAIIALNEKDMLEVAGYNVKIVYSGEKAVEFMQKDNSIDLILMDIDLGEGMDGTDAAEEILKQHDLPVIFISSHTEKQIVKKTEKITSYGYISKESDPTVILATLKMAFKLFDANRKIKSQKENLEMTQYCIDNCHLGILILDNDAGIQYANKYILDELGYSKKELTGRNISFINPEITEKKWEEIRKNSKDGIIYESTQISKSGKSHPVEITYNNIDYNDETISFSFIKNIEKQKEQEKLLIENKMAISTAQAKLSNAMQMAGLGSWELDIESNLFTFTDEFYSIFHTTAEKEGGYTMTPAQYAEKFVHPEAMHHVIEETQKAIDTDDPEYSRQLEHKVLYSDGGEGYISVRFFIEKDKNGKTIKTYGANQDITEMKKREEVIASLLKEKELLLREVHHRVKNNMRTIESLISLQLAGIPDGEARDILMEARQRISIMMNIYRNLSAQDNYQYANGRLIVLETISNITKLYSLKRKIKIETDIDDYMVTVSFAINICIIVNELVTNSYKYAFPDSSEGIIGIRIKNLDKNYLEIDVRDNGSGIPENIIKEKKYGLGLTLVESMVENSEGNLKINPGNGTEISIKLKKP